MAVTPAFSKGPAGGGAFQKISFPEVPEGEAESPSPNRNQFSNVENDQNDSFNRNLVARDATEDPPKFDSTEDISKTPLVGQPSFGPPKETQQQDLSAPDLTDKETQTEMKLLLESMPNMRDANINAHQGGCQACSIFWSLMN